MPNDEDNDLDEEGLEPTGYRSGRVRIVGAEPVGGIASADDLDVWPEPNPSSPEADRPSFADFGDPADIDVAPLPHWTEPATGEVPAILSRGPAEGDLSDDPWSSMPAPSWRGEADSDWEAGEASFEPSMLAHADEAPLGSLDDSGESDRQPWAFDLPGSSAARGWEDEPEGLEDAGAAGWGGDRQGGQADDLIGWPSTSPLASYGATGSRVSAYGDEDPITAAMPASDGGESDTGSPSGRVAVPDLDDDLGTTRPSSRLKRRAEGRQEERDERMAGAGSRPLRPPGSAIRKRAPEPPSVEPAEKRNVAAAAATGVLLAIIALIAFKIGTVASLVVVTAVVTLAAAEAYAVFRQEGFHPVTLMGLVATVSVMVATYNKGQAALPLVLILLFAFCIVWYLLGVERGDAVRGTATTLLVFCWIGAFGSYGALLLSPSLFPERHGIAFLVGAVIAGVAYDVGALVVGSWLGRHPLAASVSPNKTWEGFVGGAVICLVVTVGVVHSIHPWTVGKAADLGLVVAVVSPIGDLCESLVKRHLGRKDMGRLLPGHGGMLDRVDGLLFVLPATFYLVKALHLG